MLRGASFSLAGIAGLWAGALLFTTDRLVPRGDIRRFKHVVAVFPHADDETVTCGGTLQRFAASGALVTLVLLTGGERGNPAGVMQAELADRRRAEAGRAARALGITDVSTRVSAMLSFRITLTSSPHISRRSSNTCGQIFLSPTISRASTVIATMWPVRTQSPRCAARPFPTLRSG